MNKPYLRQHLCKVILQQLHRTLWIAGIGRVYCEGHLLLCCLADFSGLGPFICEEEIGKKKEKEKGKKKVSVCTSAPWLCQYDNCKKRKMWLFCLSQLFISTYCSRLWGVCCFFLKDLWLNRVKQSLMPEVITLQTHGLVVYLGLYAQKNQILPTFLLQCFSLFSSQPFTHSK